MSSSRTPPGDEPPADDLDELERELAADLDDDPDDEPDDELGEAGGAGPEAVQAELDAARRRVAEVPAEQVVTNHAMGLFELAAIHLSSEPPSLRAAALAIDALGALVEGLGDRLGEAAPTLQAALSQIRLAFVQVKAASSTS